MRKLYIEGDVAYWVDKEGDHIYHAATPEECGKYIIELREALAKGTKTPCDHQWVGVSGVLTCTKCGKPCTEIACSHAKTTPGADYNKWCDKCGGMLPAPASSDDCGK